MQQQVPQAGSRGTGGAKADLLLGPINHVPLRDWISAIPFEEWTQQHRLEDGKIRPSMVTDLEWHGFGKLALPVVSELLEHFSEYCSSYQWMLSVVMPGHSIPAHVDGQASYWKTRVHVPLTSNDQSFFFVEDRPFNFDPGFAYCVDTTKRHAVTNDGDTPRIHFMFDVGEL
jgi:hypothetical protein